MMHAILPTMYLLFLKVTLSVISLFNYIMIMVVKIILKVNNGLIFHHKYNYLIISLYVAYTIDELS